MRMILAVVAISLAASAPAWAQRNGADLLAAMDRNGDGEITRAEAQSAREAMFTRLDADRDGYLSETERSASRAGRGMGRADTDGDGRISRAEAMAAPYRGFDLFDRDSDGVLSAAEIENARARRGGG